MVQWKKGRGRWATYGVLPSLMIVGGSTYVIVNYHFNKFKSSFNLPFQVLKQEKRQHFIFLRPEQRNITQMHPWNMQGIRQLAAEIENFVLARIPTKLAMHLPSSLLKQRALLSQHYQSPWKLLQEIAVPNSDISQSVIDKICKHAWLDYEYRLLGQNLNSSYLCALARTKHVDERFFMKRSQLPPLHDDSVIEYMLYDVLTKLPQTDVDDCLQYFTHGALTISDERQLKKGGMWCFGGNGLNYTREIVAQEKVESFCLLALVKHSTIATHCEAMVELGILELLQRIYLLRPDVASIKRNIMRIISNISLHENLHPYVISSGWLSYLVKMSNSEILPLKMEASRALANLDRKFSEVKYEDGIYEIYPRHRTNNDPAVDIVLIHGLLGGAFHTWRQQDSDAITVGNHTSCWPETWLSQDVPNIRILSVEYDTHLSDWMPHCPHQRETRTILFRSEQILDKLRIAGVGKNRPVIWIAHSMGGLVLKNMLLVAEKKGNEELVKNTKGIIFYSTPHFGSQLAEYSRKVRKLFFPSVEVMTLSQDSPQLLKLNSCFNELMKEHHLQILSFCEMQSTSIGLGKLKVHVVPPESADIGRGPLILCDTDHLNICKPASRFCTVYRHTVDFIKSCISEDTEDEYLDNSKLLP